MHGESFHEGTEKQMHTHARARAASTPSVTVDFLPDMNVRNPGQRAGHAAKVNRDNLPPEGVSLTEYTPDAAGFIAGERISVSTPARAVSSLR